MTRFPFRFTTPYRIVAAPFGVTPATTMVEVDDGDLHVRFGPWTLDTPLTNVAGCEETGPFAFSKTAGPAHLSMADRGVTFATNGDRALCIRFHDPVPAIEPLGRIRHPGATVTVERTDQLRRLLEDPARARGTGHTDDASSGVAAESPRVHLARTAGQLPAMVRAAWNHLWSLRDIVRSHETSADPPPLLPEAPEADGVQAIDTGVGRVVERVYRAHISGPSTSPEELMTRIAQNLDRSSPPVSDIEERRGTRTTAGVGTEYRIHLPGPWEAPVRVIERTPRSIRLATLTGHMEAGQIELRTRTPDDADGSAGNLVFEIRSVARSADRMFDLVYNRLRLAREMQLYMWVDVCRNACNLAGGQRIGKIEAHTVDHR